MYEVKNLSELHTCHPYLRNRVLACDRKRPIQTILTSTQLVSAQSYVRCGPGKIFSDQLVEGTNQESIRTIMTTRGGSGLATCSEKKTHPSPKPPCAEPLKGKEIEDVRKQHGAEQCK